MIRPRWRHRIATFPLPHSSLCSRQMMTRLLFLSAAFLTARASALPFQLSLSFGNSMVLRSAGSIVWGTGSPGTSVTATLDGVPLPTAQVGDDGVWRVSLDAHPAGGPHEFTFSTPTGGELALHDVLFGDVVGCGGQSNMCVSLSPLKSTPSCDFLSNQTPPSIQSGGTQSTSRSTVSTNHSRLIHLRTCPSA